MISKMTVSGISKWAVGLPPFTFRMILNEFPMILCGFHIVLPTAFGPPPLGLFTHIQQTSKQESQQTNKATRNQPKQLPNKQKIIQQSPPEVLLEGLLGSCWPQKSISEALWGISFGVALAPNPVNLDCPNRLLWPR